MNLLLLSCCLIVTPCLALEKIIISANTTTIKNYHRLLDGKPCEQIDNFNNPQASYRAVLELVFLCQAFNFADPSLKLEIIPAPNYKRAVSIARKGVAHIPSETVWQNEIDNNEFLVSSAIIQAGEMVQGIYTSPENIALLTINDEQQLHNFSVVSQRHWQNDWKTLRALQFKKLFSTTQISSMFKMVGYQRADFLLWTFSSLEDLSQTQHNITLVPVPNLKVTMPDSRHFVVAKNANEAEFVHQTLQQGIARLREERIISLAFGQSGFFNPQVKHWQEVASP